MTKEFTNFSTTLSSAIKRNQDCLNSLELEKNLLIDIIENLLKARDNNKKIFTMGNGGSSSTSSHFVSDLLKTCILKESKRFNAICLSDNVPVLTAWANDTSYDEVFLEQLKNYISSGDIVIAFSGSGTSKNIINALEFAKQMNSFIIGFTGNSGGKFPELCDITIKVSSSDMLTIESIHVLLCHLIVDSIRSTGIPEFNYE
jgi:D-sedoheptulose 7-phosphate isomerase